MAASSGSGPGRRCEQLSPPVGSPSSSPTARGSAPARCVRCRLVRQCQVCESRPDRETPAPMRSPARPMPPVRQSLRASGAGVGRVTEELGRLLGPDAAGSPESDAAVWVGTERHLPGLPPVDLAVAVDVDGLMLATSYRAGEEALRVLARLAATAGQGGRRMLAQTSRPDAPLLEALPLGIRCRIWRARSRRASSASRRQRSCSPSSFGRGGGGRGRAFARRPLPRCRSSGRPPAGGCRWLGRGDLTAGSARALRPLVERWRQSGMTVRVDADPLDL